MARRCVAPGLAAVLALGAGCSGEAPGIAVPGQIATLDYSVIPESSGLAVSARVHDRFWFINDSGNAPELIALDLEDRRYRTVRVEGVDNRDWEDLELFDYRGGPWLAIADIGDNRARRDHVVVHFLPEPDDSDLARGTVIASTSLILRYPDGPRDAESLAVQSGEGMLYILSKRDEPPRLYRAPLPALLPMGSDSNAGTATDTLVLEFLGTVGSIPEPTAAEREQRNGRFTAQPTAMSYLNGSRRIAILTYRGIYLAQLGEDGDWLAALNGALCAVQTPPLAQGESLAGDRDDSLYVSSEGRAAPLARVPARCSGPGG